MHTIEQLVEQGTRETLTNVIDALCREIEEWQMTEKDNATFETPYTPEQREYYNRGVMSVKSLMEGIRDGDL